MALRDILLEVQAALVGVAGAGRVQLGIRSTWTPDVWLALALDPAVVDMPYVHLWQIHRASCTEEQGTYGCATNRRVHAIQVHFFWSVDDPTMPAGAVAAGTEETSDSAGAVLLESACDAIRNEARLHGDLCIRLEAKPAVTSWRLRTLPDALAEIGVLSEGLDEWRIWHGIIEFSAAEEKVVAFV